MASNMHGRKMINRNMRCIEMTESKKSELAAIAD